MSLQIGKPVGGVGEGAVLVAHQRGQLVLLSGVPCEALVAAQFQPTNATFQRGCLYLMKRRM